MSFILVITFFCRNMLNENYLKFIIKTFMFNHLSQDKYNMDKKLFITIMINYID